MAATATATKPPRFGDDMPEKIQPIPRDRITEMSHVMGFPMSIVLEGDQKIEEGEQDPNRFRNVAGRIAMYQWLRITNDTGSMVRFMEVERIHGSPGSGIRSLVLRDLWPPRFKDLAAEPIVSTGEYYVRHGGAHRKWMVIQPNGNVRIDGIMSEAEARTICARESGNPRPIGA